MGFGQMLILAGAALFAVTLKRPVWLGGRARRYTADETPNAMASRASLRSLGCYLVYAGLPLWAFGL